MELHNEFRICYLVRETVWFRWGLRHKSSAPENTQRLMRSPFASGSGRGHGSRRMLRLALALAAAGLAGADAETPIDPTTPQRLARHKDVQPLLAGFVDPTLPPYAAAGDGVADDAAALQSAIDDAYIARMTVVLPAGREFMLSTQLRFIQPQNVTGRSYGFALVAGRADGGKARPVLRLKDFASTEDWVGMPHNGTEPRGGQGNCKPSEQDCTPKVFLLFQYLETRTTSKDTIRAETFYLARLRGVDVNVGNNAGVSAVSMSSAQLASIEDVRVSGKNFHAGFNGLPGSGGFSANLEVEGGDYGVVQNQFRPNPSITGLRLVGQQKAGVVIDVSRGPVVISGFNIQGPRHPTIGQTGTYRAVLLRTTLSGKNNAFNGEDGVVTLFGASGGTAVETFGADVILRNVYTNGVKTIVTCVEAGLSLPSGGSAADPGPAVRIPTYVLTLSGGQVSDRGKGPTPAADGSAAWLSAPLERGDKAVSPWGGDSLPLLHSWNYTALPSWDSTQTLDVVRDYGATPSWMDAADDDGSKIQAAIDDACNPGSHRFGLPVFVPHGMFGLAQPLDLRGGCAELIGAGTHSTVLATLLSTAAATIYSEADSDAADPNRTKKRGCWPAAAAAAGVSGGVLTSSSSSNFGDLTKTNSSGSSSSSRANTTAGGGGGGGARAGLALVSDFNLAAVNFCPFIDLRAGRLLLRDVGTRGESAVIPPFVQSGAAVLNNSAAAAVTRRMQLPSGHAFNCTAAGGLLDRAGGLCCLESCGTCGGHGCGSHKGGEAGCCSTGIKRDCGPTVAPPCRVVGPSPSPSPPPPAPTPPPNAGGETCLDEPYVALRDGVSGRFYGLALDGCDLRHCKSSPHHVLLLIEGCQRGGEAIHLYQPSTEHLINDYQTLINASHCGVHFHSWKYENALNSESSVPPDGSGSLVKIEGSSDVSVFGASGNYHLFNQSVPTVDIRQGSSNVSVAGMVRMMASREPKTGLNWLVDQSRKPPAKVGGYHALLMYRDDA